MVTSQSIIILSGEILSKLKIETDGNIYILFTLFGICKYIPSDLNLAPCILIQQASRHFNVQSLLSVHEAANMEKVYLPKPSKS